MFHVLLCIDCVGARGVDISSVASYRGDTVRELAVYSTAGSRFASLTGWTVQLLLGPDSRRFRSCCKA